MGIPSLHQRIAKKHSPVSGKPMKYVMLLLLLLLPVALLPGSHAYLMFQERLPNGNFVPHPCKPNFIWKGVGHRALSGGGARNPFGNDFAENGFKWDKCLCQQDSDGDGRTNGEELGDPDCTWIPGVAAKHKFGLSHPGVCEPVDSPECRELNAFDIDCNVPTEFSCEATQSQDVENITIRFPETPVPPVETTYICMTFDLPSDQPYHMIAHKPIISNHDVMHHIVLYGCREDTPGSLNRILTPTQCGMAQQSCQEIIGLWQVGSLGNCFSEEYGFPLGQGGFKTVLLEFHWTNPSQRTDFVDSSGMSLFYTPKLRPHTAGVLMTGQYYLEIPPGRREYGQEGLCAPACTARLPRPIYLTESFLHMHYLGASGKTELWREGEKVMDLFKTDDYDYDRPEQNIISPPQELRPGDYIRTRCNYNSLNRGKVTYYGEGSFEEMCFNFITYYPALDFRTCGQFRMNDDCSLPEVSHEKICEAFFTDESFGAKWATLQDNCDPSGLTCRENCKSAVDEFRASPCFQGVEGLATEIHLLENEPTYERLIFFIHSCDRIFTEAAASASQNETQAVCDALATDPSFPARWTNLNEKCDASGVTCKPECPSAVDEFRKSLCFQGVFGLYAEQWVNENTPDELPNLIYLLHSCNGVFKEESRNKSCEDFIKDKSFPSKMINLAIYCDARGEECNPFCNTAIDSVLDSTCFRGAYDMEMENYIQRNQKEFPNFHELLHSCDGYKINKDDDDSDENDTNRTEDDGISGPKRYDPELNGLPSGGVCPFGGNTASAANILHHSDAVFASICSLMCALKAML